MNLLKMVCKRLRDYTSGSDLIYQMIGLRRLMSITDTLRMKFPSKLLLINAVGQLTKCVDCILDIRRRSADTEDIEESDAKRQKFEREVKRR